MNFRYPQICHGPGEYSRGPKDMLAMQDLAAQTVNKALLELRSYEEIQLHEAAKLGQLLIVLYRHLWSLEQYTLMVQDLSAALSGGVRDVLKFIHKGICDLTGGPIAAWMEDPQRCCLSTVTSASYGPLTPHSEPLVVMIPPTLANEPPPPDILRLPQLPTPSADPSQSVSPTRALKAFCSMLLASCSFSEAPACSGYTDQQPLARRREAKGHLKPEDCQHLLMPGPPTCVERNSFDTTSSYCSNRSLPALLQRKGQRGIVQ